jgi:ribonuclease P protein component
VSTRIGRIQERAVFVALRRPVGRASAGPVRVSWVPRADDDAQVGYAIGRRCGNSVRRNRLRRRLREAVRQTDLVPGAYLITADRDADDLAFEELVATVGSAMRKAATKGSTR